MEYNTCIGEILGTFIFVYVAITESDPIRIAVALFIGIIIAMAFGSKGFLNPAVALGTYGKDQLNEGNTVSGRDTTLYIGCELLGVLIALGFVYLKNQLDKK